MEEPFQERNVVVAMLVGFSMAKVVFVGDFEEGCLILLWGCAPLLLASDRRNSGRRRGGGGGDESVEPVG
jgi:hypothetical protein